MRIAAVQLQDTLSKHDNETAALELIESAAADGAQLISLPEYATCLRPGDQLATVAESLDGPFVTRLTKLAARLNVSIHVGSIAEASSHAAKCFNTGFVVSPSGRPCGIYRKVHLFDVGLQDLGAYTESDYVLPGEQLAAVSLPGLTLGLSICFDLRYAELYRALALAGADTLLVPAAFSHATGTAHWEVLLRARAIENHAWVVAAAQDTAVGGFPTYGHSMIVDPWGTVVAELPSGPGFIAADVDPQRTEICRRDIPVLKGRRPDVYERPVRVEHLER